MPTAYPLAAGYLVIAGSPPCVPKRGRRVRRRGKAGGEAADGSVGTELWLEVARGGRSKHHDLSVLSDGEVVEERTVEDVVLAAEVRARDVSRIASVEQLVVPGKARHRRELDSGAGMRPP